MSIHSALRGIGARLPSESALARGAGTGFGELNDQAMANVLAASGATRSADAPFGLEAMQAVEPWLLSSLRPHASLSSLSTGTPTDVSLDQDVVRRWAAAIDALESLPIERQDRLLAVPLNRAAIHHVHPLSDDEVLFDGEPWRPWAPLSAADIFTAREPVIGSVFAHMSTRVPGWDAAAATDLMRNLDRYDAREALAQMDDASLHAVRRRLGYAGDGDALRAGIVQGDPRAMGVASLTNEGTTRAAKSAGLIERDSAFSLGVADSLARFSHVLDEAEAAALQVFDRSFAALTRNEKLTVLAMIGAGAAGGYASGDPAASHTAMASA